MKNIVKVSFGILFATLIAFGGIAQGSEAEADLSSDQGVTPFQFESEAEIWDYFMMLCQEKPTSRCEDDMIARTRDGEIIPAPSYDENAAYRTRSAIIEEVRRRREESGVDG